MSDEHFISIFVPFCLCSWSCAGQGRKDYFLEKRRKVKAEEPVEDADWEKPAAAAGSSSSTSATANGVGTSRSHSAGPSSSRQDNGFADIHDWPGKRPKKNSSFSSYGQTCKLDGRMAFGQYIPILLW